MIKFAVSVVLGSVLLAPTISNAGWFDAPLTVFRSLNDKPWGYQLVASPEPVRMGTKSQRFEVRPGDCGSTPDWNDCTTDRERSEVSVEKKMYPGSDYWLSWSIYLPNDFQESSKVKTSLGQIHQRGGPTGRAGGFPSAPPLLQLDAANGVYQLTYHRLSGEFDNVIDAPEVFLLAMLDEMRGKWTDVVVHFNASTEDGVLQFFVNGKEVATINKPIAFKPRDFYMKYGIYRSFVSKHGVPMPTQIVYFDEVRIGSSREDVDVSMNSKLSAVD